jgi:hypothetical protein
LERAANTTNARVARQTARRVPFPELLVERGKTESQTARKTTGFLAVADFASSTHSTNRKTRCGNHWHIAGCRMSFLAG